MTNSRWGAPSKNPLAWQWGIRGVKKIRQWNGGDLPTSPSTHVQAKLSREGNQEVETTTLLQGLEVQKSVPTPYVGHTIAPVMYHIQPSVTVKEKPSNLSIHINWGQLQLWQDPIIPTRQKCSGPWKPPTTKIMVSAWYRGVVHWLNCWPLFFLLGVHNPKQFRKYCRHSWILPSAHKNAGGISNWGSDTRGTRSRRDIAKSSATGAICKRGNKNAECAQTISWHLSDTGNHVPTNDNNRKIHGSTITKSANGGNDGDARTEGADDFKNGEAITKGKNG